MRPQSPALPSRAFAFARAAVPASCAAALLAACAGGGPVAGHAPLPHLAPARPGALAQCASLAGFVFPNTTIASASEVAAGAVTSNADGVPLTLPAHCVITGVMNPRTGLDGKRYAINFEMRLPLNWNGRFFHQVNGGSDGVITTDTTRAYGRLSGGSPRSNGLVDGFAVLSSDAGHAPDLAYPTDAATGLGMSGQAFGLDPQARLDYGYAAVGTLTPMARSLITDAYGRGPDRSYMVGCSNGGRHSLVAAARYAGDYDGILAGDPGFNLPRAAVAEQWDSQALMAAAQSVDPVTNRPAIWSAFGAADLGYLNSSILAKCDALDGASDGMVQDTKACQAAFSLARDVATCAPGATPDGSCLTGVQKTALGKIFGGAKTSSGKPLYADWPFTAGLNTSGWMLWKMGASNGAGKGIGKYGLNLSLGSASTAFIFSTPPADTAVVTGLGTTLIDYVLSYDFDKAEALINATTPAFTQSSMSFMTPPNPTDLRVMKNRGGKLIVFHGTADPVFSYNDTRDWYDGVAAANAGDASDFARFFAVPGMNHCSGGPATDQFDFLTPLVAWVEQGQAPDSVAATARTAAQNPGLGTVSAGRTRPLCAYPKVATYRGSGSLDDAASFACK